jgi:hypothetical protein
MRHFVNRIFATDSPAASILFLFPLYSLSQRERAGVREIFGVP